MRKRNLVWVAAGALLVMALSASISPATVRQDGEVRITLLSQVEPHLLPRHQKAPIAIFISGHVASVKEGGVPPQLKGLTVNLNRHGSLSTAGLPVCDITQLQPASTERALDNCGDAVVGSGQFWAHIVLPGQDPYPTHGRLLVFNGQVNGKAAILAHIYTANPFPTSFVIPFVIHHLKRGPYGTRMYASLPEALGSWGYVDRIKLTLRRKYQQGGRAASYFNANCPAVAGTRSATFQLAQADFTFGQKRKVSLSVAKSCGVKGK